MHSRSNSSHGLRKSLGPNKITISNTQSKLKRMKALVLEQVWEWTTRRWHYLYLVYNHIPPRTEESITFQGNGSSFYSSSGRHSQRSRLGVIWWTLAFSNRLLLYPSRVHCNCRKWFAHSSCDALKCEKMFVAGNVSTKGNTPGSFTSHLHLMFCPKVTFSSLNRIWWCASTFPVLSY